MELTRIPGWFEMPGAYVLVDGQFGSTGKGLFAAYLAEYADRRRLPVDWITTNAGPNSGHTGYVPGEYGQSHFKILTQQVPVMAAALRYFQKDFEGVLLNAGAVIDSAQLANEVSEYQLDPTLVL